MVVPPFPAEILTDGIELGPVTAKLPGLPLFTQEMLNGTLWFVLKTVGVIFFHLVAYEVFSQELELICLLNLRMD